MTQPSATVCGARSIQTLVGRRAPDFDLPCTQVRPVDPPRRRLDDYRGRWLALIFYPRDFSFVCPTELTAFSARLADFEDRNCALLAVSVDDLATHERWLQVSAVDGGVAGLRFPLASDPNRTVACAYGVDFEEQRVAGRGLFIIDPDGVLQYLVVHNLSVGRSTEEVLRVLDALRQGGLCPASWTRADGTIDPSVGLGQGRVWGQYRIDAEIGTGGFGRVYAGWDLLLERRVALKVGRSVGRSTRTATVSEARSAARLKHPNVCAVYAVEEEDGVPLIVMEYLPGAPLDERLADGLSRLEALRIAREVTAGVAASHAAGVVHGDLKPANILFSEEGVAKVSDFGISRRVEETHPGPSLEPLKDGLDADATDTILTPGPPAAAEDSGSFIRGTPAYMAPEMTHGGPATKASDVFTCGLLLVELLTGERAIKASTPHDAIMAVRDADPVALVADVPAAQRDDLLRILDRAPPERPSMAEVEAIVSRW